MWPGQDAIGKTLQGGEKKEYQVVGVVRDSQASHLGQTDGLFFYLPAGPKEQERLQLLVHSQSGDTATANGIREAARALGRRLGLEPTFTGTEANTAWLVDCSEAFRLFGAPQVSLDTMLDWTAEWVQRGGASLGKPTHFEVRDGSY